MICGGRCQYSNAERSDCRCLCEGIYHGIRLRLNLGAGYLPKTFLDRMLEFEDEFENSFDEALEAKMKANDPIRLGNVSVKNIACKGVKFIHSQDGRPATIDCTYVGPPKVTGKASMIVGLFLCLLCLIPGLLYFAFCGGYHYDCPECGTRFRSD